ncbi:hypothetical protein ACG7TL_005619 [Trametes sanguinea]
MKKKKLRGRSSAAKHGPYDSSQRHRKSSAQHGTSALASSLNATSSAAPISTNPNPGKSAILFREACIYNIETHNPRIKPRSDWELVQLSAQPYKGTPDEVYALLDELHAAQIELVGADTLERSCTDMLNTWVEPTGHKPLPGETSKYIFVRPIPESEYSIRLLPGSISAAEYCMDFVDSATGEPVNSPFEFELWGIPDPETPWLGMPICQQMHSIERIHGIKQEDILPGHEKFILRDGQTFALIRPGKIGMRFTVPVRKQPEAEPIYTDNVSVCFVVLLESGQIYAHVLFMKSKATRQSKARSAPYDSSQLDGKRRVQHGSGTSVASSADTTASRRAAAAPKPNPGNGAVLFREMALHNVRTNNPRIEPRNDWELLKLSSKHIPGTPAEVYAWLDERYASEVEQEGVEIVCWATEFLNTWMEPTGMKPRPGEVSKYVHVRPIPESKYSIRIFPGSISAAEYCMDFVDSETGEPVNSPFEYELWAVPDPDTPWLGMPMCQQIRSIERIHGIKQEDILPGHEKFILRDGQTCVLRRPGKPQVRFNVPVRKQPVTQPQPEVHVITFPRVIDA